jgi:hypothetical protein
MKGLALIRALSIKAINGIWVLIDKLTCNDIKQKRLMGW